MINVVMSSRPQLSQTLPKRLLSGDASRVPQPSIVLKVKESAAELQNFLQEWNKLHASGGVILSSIRLLKLDSMRNSDIENCYPPGLQERCDQLQDVIDTMESCLANFAILVQQFSALVELDVLQGGSGSAVCLSWSIDKFRQAFQDIYGTYSKELLLKNTIKEEVAHCTKKEILTYYVMNWTMQPLIGSTCQLLCESLLCEVGLR